MDRKLYSHSESVLFLVTVKVFQTGEQIRTLRIAKQMQQIHRLVPIISATAGFQEEYSIWQSVTAEQRGLTQKSHFRIGVGHKLQL